MGLIIAVRCSMTIAYFGPTPIAATPIAKAIAKAKGVFRKVTEK